MSLTEIEPVLPLPATARTLPALRLLTAPATDPAYDDELPLRPTLRLVPAPVRAPAPRPALPAVRDAPHPVRPDDDEEERRPRTPTAELPPSGPVAAALVQRLLEVCAGVRPVGQLQRETTPELYDTLREMIAARPRATGLRPTRRDVRSVHVQQRVDGVAEVCATVRRGARAGAVALRLEGLAGRWVCTELVGV